MSRLWTRARDMLGGADSGGDPTGMGRPKLTVVGSSRGAVSYPDQVEYLDSPEASDALGKIPWAVQACLMEAEQQVFKEAERARIEVEGFTAKAMELTDEADDQTRVRDQLHAGWLRARERFEFGSQVLQNYVLHHGAGWLWLYGLVWVLLIVGDIAGGTLVLVKTGEYPMVSAVLTTAIGVAAVTSAKLAEDFRRRLLWLRHRDDLPVDDAERRLIIEVFTYGDQTYRFLVRISGLVGATAACLVIGTLAIRLSVDNSYMAVGFALWAAGVCGGSFVNSWWHCDPAYTTIKNLEHAESSERKRRDKAPTRAIKQRAANLAGVAERLRGHYGAAMALWFTKLTEAADILAVNPQLAGHGTDGLSFLWKLRPSGEREFVQLFDQFQVPRYYLDRPWGMPAGVPGTANTGLSDDAEDTEDGDDDDGEVIDIASKLTGIGGPSDAPIVDLPSPADLEDDDLDDTGS